jgi:hypothetical protein
MKGSKRQMTRASHRSLFFYAVLSSVILFMICTAQANASGQWLVLDQNEGVHDAASLLAAIAGEIEGEEASLLSKVLGISVKKLCTAATLVGFHLEKEGKLTNGGKVVFTGCSLDLNGSANESCAPHSAGAPIGTVETSSLKGLLAGSNIRIEPSEGTTFVNVNMGEECPIGENIPVRGTIVFKDCEDALEVHQVEHLIEEDVSTELWVLNNTPEHKMTIDGSALGFLEGEHEGLEWSGGVV